MSIEFFKLLIFLIWIATVMFLGAKQSAKSYNREFVALIMTGAFLFYGLIEAGIFLTALLSYLGIRTYQKKIEMDNNKNTS